MMASILLSNVECAPEAHLENVFLEEKSNLLLEILVCGVLLCLSAR